ncbi:MAG: hypothetical protein ACOYJC_07020 [Christensenellales bacterium]|jgi:hypothetical protein
MTEKDFSNEQTRNEENLTMEPASEQPETNGPVMEGEVVDAPDEAEQPGPRIYTEHKALQAVLGVASALLMWFLLLFSADATDMALKWGWVIFFAIIMLGRRALERKQNVIYRTYAFALLIGLIVGLVASLVAFIFFKDQIPFLSDM